MCRNRALTVTVGPDLLQTVVELRNEHQPVAAQQGVPAAFIAWTLDTDAGYCCLQKKKKKHHGV